MSFRSDSTSRCDQNKQNRRADSLRAGIFSIVINGGLAAFGVLLRKRHGQKLPRGKAGAGQLEHEDGIQTLYAHLQELLAAPGDTVKQGQIIGLSGSSGWTTGPHLHLGVYIDGEAVDPLAFLMTEDA